MPRNPARLALLCPLIAASLLAPGCGDKDKPADPPAPGKDVSHNDPAPNADAPEPNGEGASPAIAEPTTYHIDQHAGRSPFAQPGERVDTLIPARRITTADPFASPIDPDDIPAVVPWTDAAKYVGFEIVVEGEIVRVGKSGATNFLNFAEDYRGKFYMVIFDDLAATLDGGAKGAFEGKTVRVRGLVEPHRGTPQIKITSMDQVQFVD